MSGVTGMSKNPGAYTTGVLLGHHEEGRRPLRPELRYLPPLTNFKTCPLRITGILNSTTNPVAAHQYGFRGGTAMV